MHLDELSLDEMSLDEMSGRQQKKKSYFEAE
jgi:hypothetical protein